MRPLILSWWLVATTLLFAQAAVAQDATRFLGTELRLGMEQDLVLEQLSRHYETVELPDGMYMVGHGRGSQFVGLGGVTFVDNRPAYINKEWNRFGSTDLDLVTAVYGLFKQLAREGLSACTFDAKPGSQRRRDP